MSRLLSLVALVAIVAALFGSGPQQAWACLCQHPSVSEAGSVYDASDALAIVSVERIDGQRTSMRVERAFKGISAETITLGRHDMSSSCDYDDLGAARRHFLAFQLSADRTYRPPHMCASFPLLNVEGAPPEDYQEAFVKAIEQEAVDGNTLWAPGSNEAPGDRLMWGYVVAWCAIVAAGLVFARRYVP